MTRIELKRFKQRLLTQERYLQEELAGQTAELEDDMAAAGEERAAAPDDASAEIFEHEKALAVGGALQEMLTEVGHAIHKMAAGTYGICDDCGQTIGADRLEARPQAALCMACRGRAERARNPGHGLTAGIA